jgi:hypothetical protein
VELVGQALAERQKLGKLRDDVAASAARKVLVDAGVYDQIAVAEVGIENFLDANPMEAAALPPLLQSGVIDATIKAGAPDHVNKATQELAALGEVRAAVGDAPNGAALVAEGIMDEIAVAQQAIVAYLATQPVDPMGLPPLLKSDALKARVIAGSALSLPMRGPASQDLMEGWTGWTLNTTTCTVEDAQLTVSSQKLWGERHHQEKLLLCAMGREGQRYLERTFKVWRVKWGPLQASATWCAPHYTSVVMGTRTTAAFVMLESGSVRGMWAEGAEEGKWKLCGTHYGPHCPNPKTGYLHNHPYGVAGESGSMLVALPALVYGFVDLTEPRNWFFFPKHG